MNETPIIASAAEEEKRLLRGSYGSSEYTELEEYSLRSGKLEELRKLGIEPYPNEYRPTHSLEALRDSFDGRHLGHSEEAAEGKTPHVRVAGRIVLFRAMGKNAFLTIQQETTRLQIMVNRDDTSLQGYTPSGDEEPRAIKVIEKKLDLGDIIGVEGHLFFTNKGELTVYAKEVTLLCKTLLPLADKHAGLTDKEIRYRKRWLDLISNNDVHHVFRTRNKIISLIRQELDAEGFLEVETLILQSIYGGAEARPFTTELHALQQSMFMRISLEIPLKKLIIGGINKVYELGKVFRNEGIDRTHNPEFTMMEAYASYWDYNDMMRLVENLFEKAALATIGTTELLLPHPSGQGEVLIDVKAPWKRMTMKESLRTYAGYDADTMDDEDMRALLRQSGHIDLDKLKTLSRGLLLAALFEVYVEPHLLQPHHIIDHPMETTPLCKPHRKEKERSEGLVERFESFILCKEMCNAYSELNDPLLQRELFSKQADRRASGDEEAAPLDEEFLEAICQGMPPTGGVGIGIDRMVMLFTQAPSIRDVLLFPWMKPQ